MDWQNQRVYFSKQLYAFDIEEIQRLIKTGGISLNNQIIKDPMYILQPQDIIDGKWFYVKRGKRQVLFIKLK